MHALVVSSSSYSIAVSNINILLRTIILVVVLVITITIDWVACIPSIIYDLDVSRLSLSLAFFLLLPFIILLDTRISYYVLLKLTSSVRRTLGPLSWLPGVLTRFLYAKYVYCMPYRVLIWRSQNNIRTYLLNVIMIYKL
jgi:hypothetical protein